MSSSNTNIFNKSSLFQPEKLVQGDKVEEGGFKQVKLSNSEPSSYRSSPLYDPRQQEAHQIQNHTKQSQPEEPVAKEEDPLFDEVLSSEQGPPPQQSPPIPDVKEPEPEPPAAAASSPSTALPTTEEIERIREEAYKQGFEEAQKLAHEEYQTSGQALFNITEQLNQIRDVIIQNSIGEMQDLVITIAEKIIRHSVTAQDDTIVSTVEESIRQAVKSSEFYICLNRADYSVIKEKSPELVNKISGLEHLFIKIDDGIEPGGCIIESDNCTVDATIASQLQIIQDHLASRR